MLKKHSPAKAARNTVQKEDSVMGEVQEELFAKLYLEPAITWGEQEGFTEPYSFLIVCDSFLHSGRILASLRNKFSEKTPVNGGRERVWMESYVNARHTWLSGHKDPLLKSSSYRTKYYLELLKLGDWNLDKIHTVAMNGVKILEVV
jgi:chitosanase